jgi:hypothetical protein
MSDALETARLQALAELSRIAVLSRFIFERADIDEATTDLVMSKFEKWRTSIERSTTAEEVEGLLPVIAKLRDGLRAVGLDPDA